MKDYKHKLLHQKKMDAICDQVNLNEPKFSGSAISKLQTENSKPKARNSKMMAVIDSAVKTGSSHSDLLQEMKEDLESLKSRNLLDSTNRSKLAKTELFQSNFRTEARKGRGPRKAKIS